MLMSAFFKKVNSIFNDSITYNSTLFYEKGQLLYCNVAVYILDQSVEEYSLIRNAKPLTTQTDKIEINQKGKK